MRFRLVVLLAVLTLSAPTHGLDGDLEIVEFTKAVRANDVNVDYAVPESPAFTALGLNPENVTRPASPRDLAAGVLSAFDENGNFQTGAALDIAPFVLFRSVEYSLADYRGQNGFEKAVARTQLSLATTKGVESDDKAVRVAGGVRLNPWTTGDPRTDDKLMRCLLNLGEGESLEGSAGGIPDFGANPDFSMDDFDRELDAAEAKAAERTTKCLDEAERRLGGASGLDLGAAPTWIQEDTDEDVKWGGATFWGSLSLREWDFRSAEEKLESEPGNQPQLILHGRFRLDERTATEDDPSGFVDQNHLLLGTRLRSGPIELGARQLFLSIEAAYTWIDPERSGSEGSVRGALTSDLQLAEQLWLHTSLGATAGRDEDRITLGATLKWGGQGFDLAQVVGAIGSVAETSSP